MGGWGGAIRGSDGTVCAQTTAVACAGLLVAAVVLGGCGQGQATAQRPDAQDRITKLYNLYRAYVDAHQRPPPNGRP